MSDILNEATFAGTRYTHLNVEGFPATGTLELSIGNSEEVSITTIVARRLAAHLVKVADELEGKNTEN